MDEQDARARCERLATTDADRDSHTWLPRRRPDGGWEVVKVALAPPADDLTAEQRTDPRPTTPNDVRTPLQRNVPGPGF